MMEDVLWKAGLLIYCTVRQTEVGRGVPLFTGLWCDISHQQFHQLLRVGSWGAEASATLLRDSFLLWPQTIEAQEGGSQIKTRETAMFPSDYGKTVAGTGHLGRMTGCQFPAIILFLLDMEILV